MAVHTEIIAPQPSRTARAPSDVLRLVVAVVVLLVAVVIGWLFGRVIVDFEARLLQGFHSLPEWFGTALVVAGQVLGLVVLVGGLAVAAVRREWFLIGSALLAVAVAMLILVVLQPLADDTAAAAVQVNEGFTLLPHDRLHSAAALAAIAAVVTAAAPWVSRRWRWAGWALVLILSVVRFLGAPASFDTLLALLAGWVAGAATIVALGAPSRRPTGEAIAAGLAAVGCPLVKLEQASLDARGSTPYFASELGGSALFVKALGADERSADLLFRLYRRAQPRDLGDERAFSSLRRAVEHEALLALTARDLGVRTPRLRAFATAEPNGYVLAYEAIAGRSLDRLAPEEITDEVLAGVWSQLARLREHRIAHRDLRLANVFLADDGEAWIIDFGFSELAASDLLLATDLAELVASAAVQVGPERSVAAGLTAVGPEALTTALDRLQLPMLSGATRAGVKSAPGLLDELRGRLVAAGPGDSID